MSYWKLCLSLNQSVEVLSSFWIWRKSPQSFALAKPWTESYAEDRDVLRTMWRCSEQPCRWSRVSLLCEQHRVRSEALAGSGGCGDQRDRADTLTFPFPGLSEVWKLLGTESTSVILSQQDGWGEEQQLSHFHKTAGCVFSYLLHEGCLVVVAHIMMGKGWCRGEWGGGGQPQARRVAGDAAVAADGGAGWGQILTGGLGTSWVFHSWPNRLCQMPLAQPWNQPTFITEACKKLCSSSSMGRGEQV